MERRQRRGGARNFTVEVDGTDIEAAENLVDVMEMEVEGSSY